MTQVQSRGRFITLEGGEGAGKSTNLDYIHSRLQAAGAEVLRVTITGGEQVDAAIALTALADRGITRVLVESGGVLNASLLRAGMVDRIAWFRAPRLIGGDGTPAFAELGVESIEDMPAFELLSRETIGDDTLDIYRRLP